MDSSVPGPIDSPPHQPTGISEADETPPARSPFLSPGAVAQANRLAIVQLSKDAFVPVYLRDTPGEHDGYKEGHVLNTRFGSFPHSTLIGMPWGSQVRASIVDTGTRGRVKKPAASHKPPNEHPSSDASPPCAEGSNKGEADGPSEGLKRKRTAEDDGDRRVKSSPHGEAAAAAEEAPATGQRPTDEGPPPPGDAETEQDRPTRHAARGIRQLRTTHPPAAESGFVHILPPTPEIWTTSLPHRTQVVYTPDYSYILQRIRARPGTRLIEAGSGSGSFTHAAARAVYDGEPSHHAASRPPTGRVFSFEFHGLRFRKMRREVREHGLGRFVEVHHRDVYHEGFLVDGKSPEVDAVFLDLPAPWLALAHLARRKPRAGAETEGTEGAAREETWVSPLHPKKSVYLCTFSPCIEQVTRTVSEMRKLGWVEIDMVEIAHKRLQVYRDKLGIDITSERGQQLAPKNVAEALVKLREVELKSAEHNAKMAAWLRGKKPHGADEHTEQATPQATGPKANGTGSGPARKEEGKEEGTEVGKEAGKEAGLKPFMQGELVTRPEAELKAHTSYLVFAILPREWTEEDEAAAAATWPIGKEPRITAAVDRASRKQLKREMLTSKLKKRNKKETGAHQQRETGEASAESSQAVDASTAKHVSTEGDIKAQAP